jgi:hypothetical protein
MLSTWIRKFTKNDTFANKIADTWASIISFAFSDSEYNHLKYATAYEDAFGIKPQGGRLVDFVSFYQVSLVADRFTEKTESMVFDYILNHKNGIYYIYDRPIGNAVLSVLPECFASKKASRYLAAIEILSEYLRNTNKLNFVMDWIESNRNANGKWDMGSKVNDKVYFPLSDDWKNKNNREVDCTYRIQNLLNTLNPTN